MNEERHGAAGRGDPAGWEFDPIIIGVREAVTAGYQAIGYVMEGTRQSMRMRRQAASGVADPDAAKRASEQVRAAGTRAPGVAQGGRADELDLDDLVSLFSDLLASAGRIAQEVAGFIDERGRGRRPAAERRPPLVVNAHPGEPGYVEFLVRNTSSSALREVHLVSTDLIGEGGPIPGTEVTFEPHHIPHVRPGGTLKAKVAVDVPRDIKPDTYRGVIQIEPGDAWAVLEVKVTPAEDDGVPEAAAAVAPEPQPVPAGVVMRTARRRAAR